MVKIIADNILSPLGETTRDNLLAVREGRSRLQAHRLWQIPEPFVASLFDEGEERPTYELLLLSSILRCLDVCTLSGRVVLVLSSTKGHTIGPDAHPFGESARRIERLIRPFLPKVESLTSLTVSNACVSGLSALIVARRLLEMDAYDYAIVAGCDVQSRFIVAGFQSFMAMSPEPCRPFDEDRCGLNLGEAAATIIFKRCSDDENVSRQWVALPGYMRNDAYHISTPSRTAEGSYLALTAALGHVASPLCISAHGTATLYNDEMESSAIHRVAMANDASSSIHRASMGEVPVTALKGYFGHTMGAAGILESILTMHALQEGWIPATLGFNALGTSRPIHVINRHQSLSPQQKQHPSFIKMMSGFGGCNTAMGFEYLRDSKGREGILRDIKGQMCSGVGANPTEPTLSVRITPEGVTLCGEALPVDGAKGSMSATIRSSTRWTCSVVSASSLPNSSSRRRVHMPLSTKVVPSCSSGNRRHVWPTAVSKPPSSRATTISPALPTSSIRCPTSSWARLPFVTSCMARPATSPSPSATMPSSINSSPRPSSTPPPPPPSMAGSMPPTTTISSPSSSSLIIGNHHELAN